jgi:zinc transport system ATP-binding protein
VSAEVIPLRCERLVVGYGGRPLLPSCDLDIRRGKLTMVLGRNGAGKSTFFRTVLGLLPPVSGRVVRAPNVRVAYVGQALVLDRILPLRARDVVGWGALHDWTFLGRGNGESQAVCQRALAEAGAAELAERNFHDLSEGQKQRVLLARMLAAQPDVGFLDEPTAAMDAVAEEEAIGHLARLAHEGGLAVVVISHVLGLAERFADEIVFLDRDDGVVVNGPPPVVFSHPSFRRQFGSLEVHRGA